MVDSPTVGQTGPLRPEPGDLGGCFVAE